MGTLSIRATIACCAALVAAQAATAQVTAERGASLLIFPKVIADSSADTIVQLVNLSDNHIDAFCTYIDGADGCSTLSFTVTLAPRQPLHWIASRGRVPAGDDPNAVPAAPAGFRGELLCVESLAGTPFNGNQLAGQATVSELASGDVAAYPAAGLRGSAFTDGDDVLCIGEPADDCILGSEYDACPAEWIVSLPAEGASDPQLTPASRLSSRLAIAPCSGNLRDGLPATVDIDITVTSELGQQLTATASVTCWADLALSQVMGRIFDPNVIGGENLEARLAPADGSGGFVVAAQTARRADPAAPVLSSTAVIPHARGTAASPDLIILPAESSP